MKRRTTVLLLMILIVSLLGGAVSAYWPGIDDVKAAAYLVMDADTGTILVQNNIDEKLRIASLTKIVTAMVILTHPDYDPAKMVVASSEGTTFPDPNSAKVGLRDGELISTWDALRALLVMSANDAAYTLAENYASGTTHEEKVEDFAEQMTTFAHGLGATSSIFSNPAGFDRGEHYSTARDMAILAGHAMQNETFRQLVSMSHVRLDPTNLHPNSDWAIMRNTNMLVQYGADIFDSEYFTSYDGIKTGTTPGAGNCLIASGQTPDGRRLIGVLLNTTLHVDGRAVNISIPMRTLLEEGGRVFREANPLTAPIETPPATEETPLETDPEITFTDPPALDETLPPSEIIVEADKYDPTIIFILAGVGVLLLVIMIYLLIEHRRKVRARKRRQAARKLREMKDIRDQWRNPPYR